MFISESVIPLRHLISPFCSSKKYIMLPTAAKQFSHEATIHVCGNFSKQISDKKNLKPCPLTLLQKKQNHGVL